MRRSIHLPVTLRFGTSARRAFAAATASFKDGVLALTLPKKTAAGGKRLEIS